MAQVMDYPSYDRLVVEDQNEPLSAFLSKWVKSVKLVYKALLVILVTLLLPAFMSFCRPILRPIGALVLQRLWDVLSFLVLTTSIGLGILNSKRIRSTESSDSWKINEQRVEDSHYPKVPFVSMFNEMDQSNSNLANKEEAGEEDFNTSESAQAAGPITETDDSIAHVNIPADSIGALQQEPLKEGETNIDEMFAKSADKEGEIVDKSVQLHPHVRKPKIKANPNEGLAAVTKPEDSTGNSHQIIHRRASSLDCPIEQQWGKLISANHAEISSSTKVGVSDSNIVKDKASSSSVDTNTKLALSSKHSRSRSAFNLNEMINKQSTSQLSRRRKVSLSCDLGEDYSPAWLCDLPSPPKPPLCENDDGQLSQSQDNSTKAFSESLAPWRVKTSVPIEVPTKERPAKTPMLNLLEGPSTPISPSPGELNKKADAFIARFHEQMRLQRLESFERFKKRSD